jgi:hypothetical protein
MKRFALAAGAAGVLVVSGLGTGVGLAGTKYDSVSGSIKRTALNHPELWHFKVSAQAGPKRPSGTYNAVYGVGNDAHGYTGKVTCVRAEGNLATVGIVITKVDDDPHAEVGDGQVIRIVDNGNPADGGPKDAISGGAFTSSPPKTCPKPVKVKVPYVSGNVLVKDAD